MIMINCDKKCKYQNQGYCELNHITQLTGVEEAGVKKCGYFEPLKKNNPYVPSKESDQHNFQ